MAACKKKPSAGFNGYAFLAHADTSSITVLDLASFQVVRRIALPAPCSDVIAHPRKAALFTLTPSTGSVYEVNPKSFEIRQKVDTGSPVISMLLSPDSRRLWLLCQDHKLLAVDCDTFRKASEIRLPAEPYAFDLARRAPLAGISYGAIGVVSQADLEQRKADKGTKISDAVGTLRYRSDGESLLVANTSGRMLSVLQAPGSQVVAHLPLAVRPDNFCFNNNEGQLFISGEGRDAVVVVYPYYVPQVAETVLAGHAPGAMAASATMLFVANPQAGSVSVININHRKVIAVAGVGQGPSHITITPDGEYALVLNRGSGDVAVLRTRAIAPGNKQKSAALFWMIPVGSQPVNAAVMQTA